MKAFVIFRDRVTYASQCVAALDKAGLDVIVIDHGTTWQPAVDWLAELRKHTGVAVIDQPSGGHPRDIWSRDWFRRMCANDRYIVTDPDVVPSEDCPADWVGHLDGVLDRFPSYHKAGLGLRIDRVPDHYAGKAQVLDWEAQFWRTRLGDEAVYHADVDTTLALHIPLSQMGCHSFTAVRTGPPYMADHLAWHEHTGDLTDEQAWYHEHAEPGVSMWVPRGRSDIQAEVSPASRGTQE